MPKPCKKPLTPNPFESYRDPATGQWRVKYIKDAIPRASLSKEVLPPPPTEESASQIIPSLQHRMEKSARNRGTARQATA
ncbi:MAG: hypothetical protein AAF716_00950 [Cyanobacteria bacterium P01_D01_bin.1]